MNHSLRRLRARAVTALADARLALFRPRKQHPFWIVSTLYNAAEFVERNLNSIAAQSHARYQHLLIDDASSDETGPVVSRWLERNGDTRVRYRRNERNRGGCANLTEAFREAPPGSIVLQVDGDDWLPDPRVLAYLNMVYHDPDVWMTYNSWRFPDGQPSANSEPIPAQVIRAHQIRAYRWISSHLHSFRRELFDHVRDESLIDPETGEYFRASVDLSHYLPMLELAGTHARHLQRITYVYNLHSGSLISSARDVQTACEARIRALPSYQELATLVGGA